MLGLGSQIKPHITKRFSMPWSHPAPRMRELILAIRAIWERGRPASRSTFRGEFYTHTLMTPVLQPGPEPLRQPQDPPGRRGRAHDRGGRRGRRRASGARLHHRALPARGQPAGARAGAAKAGKTRARPDRLVPGLRRHRDHDEAEHGSGRQGGQRTDRLLRLDAGLPPVLELHGWGDLQPELNTLSKRGEWVKMGELIDDDVLDAFAVVGPLDEVAAQVHAPLRRRRRPLQLLRPLQGRARAVARGAGGVPLADRRRSPASDDDVDQAGRPDHDPAAARPRPAPRSPWAEARAARLGLAVGDAPRPPRCGRAPCR